MLQVFEILLIIVWYCLRLSDHCHYQHFQHPFMSTWHHRCDTAHLLCQLLIFFTRIWLYFQPFLITQAARSCLHWRRERPWGGLPVSFQLITIHRQLSKTWFCCTQWVLVWLCRWMFLMAMPFEILIMWRRLLTQGKVHNCPSAILQFYSGGLFNIETTETNNILSDFDDIIAIDYTDNNRWHRQQWCHE